MNKLHRLAVEMKYQGLTHGEISKILKGKLTKGTIDVYFSKDGLLYNPYLEYEAKQNEVRMRDSKSLLQKESTLAAQSIIATLKQARDEGKHGIVIKAAEAILVRTEIKTSTNRNNHDVSKSVPQQAVTKEEFFKRMKEKGIDAATGIRIRAIQMLSVEEKAKTIRDRYQVWYENGILGKNEIIEVTIRQTAE